MARLETTGFEENSVSALWDANVGGGVTTISSATVRSGSYAGRILTPALGVLAGWHRQFHASATGGLHALRFYLNIHTLPTVATVVAYLHSAQITSNATTPVASIVLQTDGTLLLKDGTTTIGSASAALSLDTWHRIEFLIDDTAASGSRTIAGRIDGTSFASSTTSTSTYSVNWFGIGANFGLSVATGSGEWFFDDIGLNDGTGSAQTSYPGDGKVVSLRPVGAGDDIGNEFIDGDGGGGANWTKVDEVTPDGATTYVKRDEAAGSATRGDMYTLTDPTTVGMAAGDTIALVQLNIYGGAGSASGAISRSLIYRILSTASGTAVESDSGGVDFSNNNVTTFNGQDAPHTPKLTAYVSPHSGTAWTVTGSDDSLSSLQVGYKTVSTGGNATNGARVSTVWVTVEYVKVPATAALTGTAGCTATLGSVNARARSLTDTAGCTGTLVGQAGKTVALTDAAGCTATVASAGTRARALTDTAGCTATVSASSVGQSTASFSDVAGCTATMSGRLVLHGALSGTAHCTATLTGRLTFARGFSDPAGCSATLSVLASGSPTSPTGGGGDWTAGGSEGHRAFTIVGTAGCTATLSASGTRARGFADTAGCTASFGYALVGPGPGNFGSSLPNTAGCVAVLSAPTQQARGFTDAAGCTGFLTLGFRAAFVDRAGCTATLTVLIHTNLGPGQFTVSTATPRWTVTQTPRWTARVREAVRR